MTATRVLLLFAIGLLLAAPVSARFPPHGGAGGGVSPGPLSLLAVEDGTLGQLQYNNVTPLTLGGVGKFLGTAPSSMTATISGCGGGALTTSGLVTPVYGTGTYQVQFSMPTATGTGCVITVTDDLSRTAISPAIKVNSATPGSPISVNIHNAPGWIASHSYSPASGPKTRVLNGAGWTSGSPGHFNPGSDLKAYELTSGSSCTSASSGGPSGTGGSITDGGCTWKYLSGVDYITINGWEIDAPLWVSGKTYTYFEFMTLNDGGTLRAYQLDGSDTHAFCTSTVAPTGTGTAGGVWSTGLQTTADTCKWGYLGDVTYSSQVAPVPTSTYVNAGAAPPPAATSHQDRPYTALLWNDAEYVAGVGGERSPITVFGHSANLLGVETHFQGPLPILQLTTAPGEGFASSLTTSTPLVGYDATKGVAVRNPDTTGHFGGAFLSNAGAGAAGFFLFEYGANVVGLQIKSEHGIGLAAFNGNILSSNIIDGGNHSAGNGSWCTAVYVDNIAIVVNNLILSHGCGGIGVKYGNSFVLWNTFVNVGPISDTSALIYNYAWVFQDVALANNAVSGYAHVAAQCNSCSGNSPSTINSRSVGNVTDVTGPDNTGTSWWIDQTANHSDVEAVPGTTFGVSAASMFISPGSDYRPNTGLSTAGAAFGSFYVNCLPSQVPATCTPTMQTWDTPDILGNPRPNGSAQYSTGAEQHP